MQRYFYVFLVASAILAACSDRLLVKDYPRATSHAPLQSATANTTLGKAVAAQSRGHDGQSGFHLLPRGDNAFLARIALVEAAQRSVDLQYFSSRNDTTGKLLLEAMVRAARRGVHVRLLLDDLNIDDFKEGLVALSNEPNIEIRVFNPLTTRNQLPAEKITNYLFARGAGIARRMHNKALIADNQMALMGGRNLGDEYFGASAEFNFRDMDVLSAGPIVAKISQNFDTFWNSRETYPLTGTNLPTASPAESAKQCALLEQYWDGMIASPAGQPLRDNALLREIRDRNVPLVWAKAEFAADNPRKIEQPTDVAQSKPEAKVDALADNATHEFLIISPYFIPLDDGTDWLTSLAKAGVKVRVLTNSLASTDMIVVHAGYSHYREKLLAGGVDLYEMKAIGGHRPHTMFRASSSPSSLHTKLYVVDRRALVIGSFNMDPRSEQYNTEQVLVIHSPELAGEVVKLFDHVTSPELSYHVMLAPVQNPYRPQGVPDHYDPADKRMHLVWVTTNRKNKTVEYDYDPQAGPWRHVINGLFSIIPIDGEL